MNSKGIFWLFVLIIIYSESFAQKDFYQGYVVTNRNDTIHGMVKDRKTSNLKFYNKIQLKTDNGRKKKYGANEIIAYKSVAFGEYHSVWYDQMKFLRVVEPGLVTYYVDESLDEDNNLFETKLLKRYNERTCTTVIGIGFRKKMKKYFADCPDLVNKLQNKEFRFNSLGAAVNYYNNECN